MDIQDIYALIPRFHCKAGCTLCCTEFGVPSMTRVEAERVDEFLRLLGMPRKYAEGTTCPYVDAAGCTIYPVRPLICRLYGTSPNYLCRVGARPVALLSEDEEEDVFHFYYRYFSDLG